MGSVPNSLFRRGSLWDNDVLWNSQTKCDSANPFQLNQLFGNECNNNNNMKFNSSTWDFPVIGDKYEKTDEEKENLNWIPSMIQSLTVSFSNLNKNNNLGDDKSEFLCASEDSGIELSIGSGHEIPSNEIISKIGTADTPVEGDDERDAYPVDDVDPDTNDEFTELEDEITQVVPQLIGEVDRSAALTGRPTEADTLQTFLSKFDEKVAAIWGHPKVLGPVGSSRKNPWQSNSSGSAVVCTGFQNIENGSFHQNSSQRMQQPKIGSYVGFPPTACKVFTSPASKSDDIGFGRDHGRRGSSSIQLLDPEYYIVRKDSDDDGKSSLDLLNHSEETSGFIRFVPETSPKQSDLGKSTVINMWDDLDDDAKEGHLGLDCDEEKEIIEACWKGQELMDTADDSNDLLTSWKTHFRTVIAQEILLNENYDNGDISPHFVVNPPMLPEFHADFEEDEYALFRGSSAVTFPLRFKVCHENEKGNQTDFSVQDSADNVNDIGDVQCPFINMNPTQYGEWCSKKIEDPYSSFLDMEFSDNQGSGGFEDMLYDPAYDGRSDTFAYLNDSDHDLQFQYYWSPDAIDTKQKARRSKTKARPCKYFFLDGSCRRGDDCKFSHSLITCRFWAEGSCLKGDACPFLHCFLDDKYFTSEILLDDSQMRSKYQLESESDFPSLESTKVSSRVPMEIATKAIDILSPVSEHRIENMESQFDERDGNGWPKIADNGPATNWIYSLITVDEKRKKKKH